MQDATLADMPNKLRRTRTLTVKVKRNTVGSTRQKAKTDTELCEPSVKLHKSVPGMQDGVDSMVRAQAGP